MTVTLDTPKTTLEVEPLVIAGRTFRSRLFLGTGKYPDFPTMAAALEALRPGLALVRCWVRPSEC